MPRAATARPLSPELARDVDPAGNRGVAHRIRLLRPVPAPASAVWAAARPRQSADFVYVFESRSLRRYLGRCGLGSAPNFRRRSRFRTDGPIALMTVMRNAAPDSLCHGRVDDQEPS